VVLIGVGAKKEAICGAKTRSKLGGAGAGFLDGGQNTDNMKASDRERRTYRPATKGKGRSRRRQKGKWDWVQESQSYAEISGSGHGSVSKQESYGCSQQEKGS